MLFTVIRGPLASDWYPYPFADVTALGYLRVVINGLWIGLLFMALAAAGTAVDRRVNGGQAASPAPDDRLRDGQAAQPCVARGRGAGAPRPRCPLRHRPASRPAVPQPHLMTATRPGFYVIAGGVGSGPSGNCGRR